MKNYKRLIFFIICTLVVTTFVSLFFILKPSNINQTMPDITDQTDQNDDEKNNAPNIICEDNIIIDKLETHKINYSLQNINDNTFEFIVKDKSIVTVDNIGNITPIGVGNTTITLQVNSNPIVTKQIQVTVIDCVTVALFEILDFNLLPASTIYTNTYYYLKVTQDAIPDIDPTITCSMSEFTLENKNDNVYLFKFICRNFGEIIFGYQSKYVNKNATYTCLNYPSNFDVSFSNSFNENKITLFVFDEAQKSLANDDGIFNSTSFEFLLTSNSNDEIQCILNCDYVEIKENSIYAKSVGNGTLSFVSKVSGVTKTFNVEVKRADIYAIYVNDQIYEIGTTLNFELSDDECIKLDFEKYPIYALGELNIIFNSNKITNSDSNYALITNDGGTIEVYSNSILLLTINLFHKESVVNQITYNITVDATHNCTGNIQNNILSISTTNIPAYLNLKCLAYENETLLSTQSYTANFSNQSICRLANQKISNGVIQIEILSIENCTLTIYDTINDIQIIISIIVN